KNRIHVIQTPEPYDPANPGFVRPDRPTSVTNTGARKVSHGLFKPRRKSRAVIKPPTASLLKLVSRPEFPITSQAETPAEKMDVANPGPRERSPQLTAKQQAKLGALFGATPPRETTPLRAKVPTSTSNHGTGNNKTINPGPRERSPQLMAVPVPKTAAWLSYDDVSWLQEYPDHFVEQPGDLFSPPKKIQTPLERLLASLTPLNEVKDERVTKRCTFTAYDKALRLLKSRATKTSRRLKSSQQTVPKIKPQDKVYNYINSKIKKLHKDKSKLLTTYHKQVKTNPNSKEARDTKAAIKTLKDEIHKEFNAKTQKEKISIADIKLKPNDSLIINHKCNTNRASLKNNQLTFSDPVDKLDIIGTHFERINSPRYLNDGTATREIVDSMAEIIKQEAYNFKTHNGSHTTFNDENLATNPGNPDSEGINLFLYAIRSTVNSPIYFIILTAKIISTLNQTLEQIPYATKSIAFADDAIIYLSGTSVPTLQEKLQAAADDLTFNYSLWNLRVNPSKCEVILFRRTFEHLSAPKKKGLKDFQITMTQPRTGKAVTVPRKTTVRYLGVHLDYTLKNKDHLDTQLKAASNAFKANNNFRPSYSEHRKLFFFQDVLGEGLIRACENYTTLLKLCTDSEVDVEVEPSDDEWARLVPHEMTDFELMPTFEDFIRIEDDVATVGEFTEDEIIQNCVTDGNESEDEADQS
ncbi:hypothetical protein KQX54_003895, partial [Cotesia glomerata]